MFFSGKKNKGSKHDTCSTPECSSVARKTKDLNMIHVDKFGYCYLCRQEMNLSLIRDRNCLPFGFRYGPCCTSFKTGIAHPSALGAVRVAHLFSFLCWLYFCVLFVFVLCLCQCVPNVDSVSMSLNCPFFICPFRFFYHLFLIILTLFRKCIFHLYIYLIYLAKEVSKIAGRMIPLNMYAFFLCIFIFRGKY